MKDQRVQARWIAVLPAIAIALYLCWLMLRPFVGVLEWATVLVIVFYPVHKRLAKRIKRPGLGALISCLLVILVVVLPLTFLSLAVAGELSKVVPNLPARLSELLKENKTAAIAIRRKEFVAMQSARPHHLGTFVECVRLNRRAIQHHRLDAFHGNQPGQLQMMMLA